METADPPVHADALLAILTQLVQELHPGRTMPAVTLDSHLERDLGLDSLARVELLLRIERELGLTAAEDAALGAQTAAELLRLLGIAAPVAMAAAPAAAGTAEVEIPQDARTLTEVLQWHAQRVPDRVYLTFHPGDAAAETLTFGELYHGAAQVAGRLIARGIQPGDRVALMLPSGLEFFFAFYGILLAGAVPAPLYPPTSRAQLEDHLLRQVGILDNAQAPILITVDEARHYARLLKSQCATLRHLCAVPELRAGEAIAPVAVGPEALGLIQYTSGSTGQPKGVMLSHANLLANVRAMGRAAAATSDDVFVSWLPLYHDMGLIGACLGSLHYGMRLALMSPLSFIARPVRWLRAIHEHRGTLSAAPNFAYDLCATRLRDEELEGLDLSCWRLAFNGAEPVHPDTLDAFCRRFAACGFRREAMTPVYGLAENAVGLAFPPLGRGPRIDSIDRERFTAAGRAEPAPEGPDALRFVSGGRALPDHAIRIVDDRDRDLGERRQGRLQFRGPSATRGYFRNDEATAALLHGAWRDSGDYAYLADGEVFITGRAKDLIIRAGRNLYPYELEQAVGDLPGMRKNAIAVFAARGDGPAERLVVLAETRERDAARLQALRERIDALALQLTGTRPDDIVLAPPRSVLKTSSGKIRRVECRKLYEQGAFAGGVVHRQRYWRQRLALAGRALHTLFTRGVDRARGDLYVLYAWLCCLVCTVPITLLVLLLPRRAAQRSARIGARTGLRLAGMRIARRGETTLPTDQVLVLVANHASYLDAIVLTAALDMPLRFVAKRALRRPLFGTLLAKLGTEFVARDDVRQSVDDAARVLDRVHGGDGVVFFPEATFTAAPGLRPFRLGAFKVAMESGAALVPIALRGTREMLRGSSWRPRPGIAVVWVGTPLTATGTDWPALVDLRDRARAQILAHCGEPDLAEHVSIALPEGVRP
ncbi:MAG: AMP-binding protein [Pseudomonadota bacterium]